MISQKGDLTSTHITEYERWLAQLLGVFDSGVGPLVEQQVLPVPSFDTYSTFQPPSLPSRLPASLNAIPSPPPAPPPPPPVVQRSVRRKAIRSQIKKPSNAFILYRSDLLTRLPREKTKGRNASVVAGEHWRELCPAQQQHWYDMALREKIKYDMEMAAAGEKCAQ